MNYEKLKDLADRLRASSATRYYSTIITESLTCWYSRKEDPSLLIELDMLSSWLKGAKHMDDAELVEVLATELRARAYDRVFA